MGNSVSDLAAEFARKRYGREERVWGLPTTLRYHGHTRIVTLPSSASSAAAQSVTTRRLCHGFGCAEGGGGQFRYEGQWEDGRPHGLGLLTREGSAYCGEFCRGKLGGWGVRVSELGVVSEGLFDSQGEMTFGRVWGWGGHSLVVVGRSSRIVEVDLYLARMTFRSQGECRMVSLKGNEGETEREPSLRDTKRLGKSETTEKIRSSEIDGLLRSLRTTRQPPIQKGRADSGSSPAMPLHVPDSYPSAIAENSSQASCVFTSCPPLNAPRPSSIPLASSEDLIDLLDDVRETEVSNQPCHRPTSNNPITEDPFEALFGLAESSPETGAIVSDSADMPDASKRADDAEEDTSLEGPRLDLFAGLSMHVNSDDTEKLHQACNQNSSGPPLRREPEKERGDGLQDLAVILHSPPEAPEEARPANGTLIQGGASSVPAAAAVTGGSNVLALAAGAQQAMVEEAGEFLGPRDDFESSLVEKWLLPSLDGHRRRKFVVSLADFPSFAKGEESLAAYRLVSLPAPPELPESLQVAPNVKVSAVDFWRRRALKCLQLSSCPPQEAAEGDSTDGLLGIEGVWEGKFVCRGKGDSLLATLASWQRDFTATGEDAMEPLTDKELLWVTQVGWRVASGLCQCHASGVGFNGRLNPRKIAADGRLDLVASLTDFFEYPSFSHELRFCPPEILASVSCQRSPPCSLDLKSDVWTFGVLLRCMLHRGALPFREELPSAAAVLSGLGFAPSLLSVAESDYVLPPSLYRFPTSAEPLECLAMHCTRPNPADRPSMEQVEDSIKAYLEHLRKTQAADPSASSAAVAQELMHEVMQDSRRGWDNLMAGLDTLKSEVKSAVAAGDSRGIRGPT